MILIHHPETLELEHVIYERPIDYEKLLKKQGKRFVSLAEHLPIHEVKLSKCAETGKVLAHHHAPGEKPRLIEHKKPQPPEAEGSKE